MNEQSKGVSDVRSLRSPKVLGDVRDEYDEDGYLKPREGDRIPTHSEFAALLQAIVTDVGEARDASLSQPLAERFAQYLDAIYAALGTR